MDCLQCPAPAFFLHLIRQTSKQKSEKDNAADNAANYTHTHTQIYHFSPSPWTVKHVHKNETATSSCPGKTPLPAGGGEVQQVFFRPHTSQGSIKEGKGV